MPAYWQDREDRRCHAEPTPPHGQDCPEDIGVADLEHPEGSLYEASNDDQESDERNHCSKSEYQWLNPPEGVVISFAAIRISAVSGLDGSKRVGLSMIALQLRYASQHMALDGDLPHFWERSWN